jgi:hypothetical protein
MHAAFAGAVAAWLRYCLPATGSVVDGMVATQPAAGVARQLQPVGHTMFQSSGAASILQQMLWAHRRLSPVHRVDRVNDGQYHAAAILHDVFCAETAEAAQNSATAANSKLCRRARMLPPRLKMLPGTLEVSSVADDRKYQATKDGNTDIESKRGSPYKGPGCLRGPGIPACGPASSLL